MIKDSPLPAQVIHPSHATHKLTHIPNGYRCNNCGYISVGGSDSVPGTLKFPCEANRNKITIVMPGKVSDVT